MGVNHARVYSTLKAVELVACSDISKSSEEKARTFGANFYTDYKKMLSKEKPEIVSICVPTTLHKKVAVDCLRRGINTLVEKPIADSEKNASSIINVAKKTGAKLMVGHLERFNPVITAIKNYISSNGGKIFSINIERVGPIPPRIKDVGVVLDLGTHDIDISTFLTKQKVKQVYCTTNSYTNPSKHEDSAHITLELSNGISVSITTNWLTPYKQRTIQVITDKSVIHGNLQTQELVEFTKNGNSYTNNNLPVEKTEPLSLEIKEFVNSIKKNSVPPITGEDGSYALKIAQLCLKSAKEKRAIKV
ncbi:TPA: Gfo/Idh/MocA family oxidoreductase [archaeon]|uniref:Gfo/Idh/MocA family oxidoreductase n=1 Tax=Candidatus Naiadarchaeum limnaeum TaxID=2756139 RepID=A0A832XIF2_9ARCH|nr:Gfo/Idh/MocA family oxidoreductase [Candidatus Naiadarchaeum limnaeum]